MAVFVPARRHLEPRSPAERKVLDWLATLDDSWTVLHSVGLARHASKPWAEADVVLVGPPGVLVLEVKGGRLERRNGRWGFRNRFDHVNWRNEGPWDQAGSAAAALRRDLLEGSVVDDAVLVVWGVLLPDAQLTAQGPDILLDVTLDASRVWRTPDIELAPLLEYWNRRLHRLTHCDEQVRQRLVDFLRGDAVGELSARAVAATVQAGQESVLDTSSGVLSALSGNAAVVVRGRADVGAAVLARRTAAELAAEVKSVVLVVPTDESRSQVEQGQTGPPFDVVTVADLALDVLGLGPGDAHIASDEGRRVAVLSAVAQAAPRYAAAVVLAADALDAGEWRLLDAVLEGGLARGTWRAFTGPDDLPAPARAGQVCVVRLERGRCTSQVASAGSILGDTLLDVATDVSGPEVGYVWWSAVAEHDALLAALVDEKSSAYGADEVLVLMQQTGGDPAHRGAVDAQGVSRQQRSFGGSPLRASGSPLGLEYTAVIIGGVEDISTSEARAFLLVAAVATTVDLTVLLHEAVRPDFLEAQVAHGRRLTASRPVGR